jgi:single-stranded-DNA-specific exonuclease
MTKEKIWKNHTFKDNDVDIISDELNITRLLAKVLITAGFNADNYKDIDRFLNPKMEEILDYKGLTSPEQLNKSFVRIKQAIDNKEKVYINGDPDADGISGTTVLAAGLRQLGLHVTYEFPVRSKEGHGLQLRIIQQAKKHGATLIVTTDCGTKDVEAVQYANDQNMDVIITDHHILGKALPNATAIINPYLNTDPENEEYRYLSGSYVSFKWIMGLKDYLGVTFPKQIFECLVICSALGVVSDRVSMKKPMNRAMVKLGIDYLNATKLPGMKALKEISLPKRLFLRARDISRTIAPRMNAPGRIGDPALGIPDSSIIVDLLLSGLPVGPRSNIKKFIDKYKQILHRDRLIKSNVEVDDQVGLVDDVNNKRKKMTEEIEQEIEHILENIDLDKESVIIIKGKDWNSGVIGIDADRLRDRFVKPGIVITSLTGSEFVKGSVRSIPTINMYAVMEQVQNRFQEKHGRNPYCVVVQTETGKKEVNAFGGHAQACGFSMHQNDIEEWERILREEVAKLPKEEFDFSYYSVKMLHFFDINHKLLLELDNLAPYGEGFDFPVFVLKGITLPDSPRPFGNRMQKDKTPHVEFKVCQPGKINKKHGKGRFLRATAFGMWEKYQNLLAENRDGTFELIFTLDYPHRRESKRPMPHLMVLDIRASENSNVKFEKSRH